MDDSDAMSTTFWCIVIDDIISSLDEHVTYSSDKILTYEPMILNTILFIFSITSSQLPLKWSNTVCSISKVGHCDPYFWLFIYLNLVQTRIISYTTVCPVLKLWLTNVYFDLWSTLYPTL